MNALSRRQFVVTSGAAAAALALNPAFKAWPRPPRACAASGGAIRTATGAPRRCSTPIPKRSGTQIAAESLGWGDYWTKLGHPDGRRQRA